MPSRGHATRFPFSGLGRPPKRVDHAATAHSHLLIALLPTSMPSYPHHCPPPGPPRPAFTSPNGSPHLRPPTDSPCAPASRQHRVLLPHQNPLFPRQTPKTSRPAPSAHLALRPARAPAHPSPKARPACPRSCSLPHPRPPRAAALHRASGARSETRTPCSRSPTTVRTRA